MSKWVIKGLKTGLVTTRYPKSMEDAPGVSPGYPRPALTHEGTDEVCPTRALYRDTDGLHLSDGRCVHCFRCKRGTSNPVAWDKGFEVARLIGKTLPKALQKSAHIRVIDAGDCGACLNEVRLLNNPFYNMHRLGFFITPTPRQADILLVVGPVSENMQTALIKTYEAMPEPRRVMAVGACALSGGVFGPGFASGSGVSDILPVDIEIPGCPPPPLAILHGLLRLAGRTKDGGEQ